MADPELAPWLQAPTGSPQPDVAPWIANPPTGTLEDVGKTILPSVVRGVVGAATMPGTLTDELKKGTDWAIGKISPEALKRIQQGRQQYQQDAQKSVLGRIEQAVNPDNVLPTYDSAMNKVQQVTGPLYEAQTPVGRAVEGSIEALPSLAMGGEGLATSALRAAGSGIGGELVGDAAKYAKPFLPEWAQGAAEPVARAIGTVAGAAIGPRAVTPFPMNDTRAATVAALKKQAPNFPYSAGQQANSPWLLSLEARSPRMAALPDAQAESFTNAAMREMGSDGSFNTPNLAQGKAVGDALGNARRAGQINSQNFPSLVQNVNQERNNLRRIIGTQPNSTTAVDEIRNDIVGGAAGQPGQVLNMPGARYNYLRQKIQGMIDAAPTGEEKTALANIRGHLDNAFYNSLPADQAANIRNLNNQYSNYQIMQGIPPERMINETVSPQDVLNSGASYMGRSGVNLENTSLAPLAKNAAKLMVEHPEVSSEGLLHSATGPFARIVGAAAGGAGAAAAHMTHSATDPLMGVLVGQEAAGPAVELAKRIAGRTLSRPTSQAYLKNQLVTPNRSDPSMILRLLLSPPETRLLPQQ